MFKLKYGIIGFTGLAGCGKTTAADFLCRTLSVYSIKTARLSFAAEVKRIAKDSFGWDGVKDSKGRRLLQTIGTDCGRLYNPDMWVNKLKQSIGEHESWQFRDSIYVIDDLRFNNEATFIKRRDGLVIHIIRNEQILVGKAANHISEAGINTVLVDIAIHNLTDLTSFNNEIRLFVKDRLVCDD